MGDAVFLVIEEPQPKQGWAYERPVIKRSRYRISTHPTYDEALAEFQRLDEAHRDGRLFRVDQPNTNDRWSYSRIETRATALRSHFTPVDRAPKDALWSYLAVRDEADPQWRDAKPITVTVADRSRGVKNADEIVRRYAKSKGYHGHEGGWIYRDQTVEKQDRYGFTYVSHAACVLTSHQGWVSWAIGNMRSGSLITAKVDGVFRHWLAA